MKHWFKIYIVKLLKEIISKIETDNCELNEEQAMDIMSIISHEVLSKESACLFLNISRSKFDTLVREGKLPKGRKIKGFKELIWYKDELIKFNKFK